MANVLLRSFDNLATSHGIALSEARRDFERSCLHHIADFIMPHRQRKVCHRPIEKMATSRFCRTTVGATRAISSAKCASSMRIELYVIPSSYGGNGQKSLSAHRQASISE